MYGAFSINYLNWLFFPIRSAYKQCLFQHLARNLPMLELMIVPWKPYGRMDFVDCTEECQPRWPELHPFLLWVSLDLVWANDCNNQRQTRNSTIISYSGPVPSLVFSQRRLWRLASESSVCCKSNRPEHSRQSTTEWWTVPSHCIEREVFGLSTRDRWPHFCGVSE